MSKKQVVVYGASGYTGRLVCEFLREYQVPFVAAGRNQSGHPQQGKVVADGRLALLKSFTKRADVQLLLADEIH